MKDRLKCNAVPIQLPIGSEDTFRGIIDLVEMKAEVYYDDLGKDMREEEIPADMLEKAEEYHNELLEHVAEQDDELMEKYLMGEEITKEEIMACIRKATSEQRYDSCLLRYLLQKQGRTEAPGCNHCITCRLQPTFRTSRVSTRRPVRKT